MKSLYGLLMLLPQSDAYRTLRDRLSSVTAMATAIGSNPSKGTSSKSNKETVALLQQFEHVQSHHAKAKGIYV